MKHFKHLITTLIVLILFSLVFARKTYAYLDPGTGSFILQLIIAGFFGGLLAIKIFWKKIKIFFKNLFSKEEKHEKDEN